MENLFFSRGLFADMSVQNRNMKHGGGLFFFFHILDPVDGNFADKCLILKEKPTAFAFEEICSSVRRHVFIVVKNSSLSGMVLRKIILCEMVL